MSGCSPCGTPILNGQGGGGGGGGAPPNPEVLFTVGANRDTTTVFPVLTTTVSYTLLANRIATTGSMLRLRFAGTVVNNGAAVGWTAPFFGIDAISWFGTTTAQIVNNNLPVAWDFDADITRKTAATFAAAGSYHVHTFDGALTGIGDALNPNLGGPISSVTAGLACDWTVNQQIIILNSNEVAGMTFTILTGSIEALNAP
jgi:hypothetical protein